MNKLREKFINQYMTELKDQLNLENINQVPRLAKIVVSAKTGDIKEDRDAIQKTVLEISEFCGQKPQINNSRKAVSSFKLRIGQPVGISVTLRSDKMYDFVTRLVNIALPRVRDFKGLKKSSFDGRGNYSIGISEHIIMPEIKYEGNSSVFGFQVNIHTTAKNNQQSLALLEKLGFPFEKNN